MAGVSDTHKSQCILINEYDKLLVEEMKSLEKIGTTEKVLFIFG